MMSTQASTEEIYQTCPIDYGYEKYEKYWEKFPQSELSYLKRHFSIYEALAKECSRYGNQLIYQSPSSISLILIAEDHPLLVDCRPVRNLIKRMEVEVNPLILENPAKGKRKKGAAKLTPSSLLVTFKVFLDNELNKDEDKCLLYPICSSLEGSVVEINQKLLENPFMIFDAPDRDAYIGIILPKFEIIQESAVLEKFSIPKQEQVSIESGFAVKENNPTEYTDEQKKAALKENKNNMRKSKKKAISAVERDNEDNFAPIIKRRSERQIFSFEVSQNAL